MRGRALRWDTLGVSAARRRNAAASEGGRTDERWQEMPVEQLTGPVDFVVIEFTESVEPSRTAQAILQLVDLGTVRLFDVVVVRKTPSGPVEVVGPTTDGPGTLAGLADLAWAHSGLIDDDDVQDAGAALRPGTLAVIILYENTWAVPFVTAALEDGGELVASGRVPAEAVEDALDALESNAPPAGDAGQEG